MLTETLLLGLLGGALGLAAGAASSTILRGMLPEWVPRTEAVGLSVEVVLFAAVVSVLTGLVVGLLPGLRLAGRPAAHALRGSAPGSHEQGGERWTTWLVGGEVALATVLAVAAGLMVRSYSNLVHQPVGFEPEQVLMGTVAFDTGDDPDVRAEVARMYEDLTERLEADPAVEYAGGIHLVALGARGNWNFVVVPEGMGLAADDPKPDVNFRVVIGHYFDAMGIPLLRGRDMDLTDRADTEPVAVVNQTFAERFWPGQDPIGKEFRLFWEGGPRRVVVGVVGDVRQHSVAEPARPEFYVPNRQWDLGWTNFVIRYRSQDPSHVADLLRTSVHARYPDAPVLNLYTMSEVVSHALSQDRLGTTLIALFAVISLGLGLVGIFGVVSFSVNRRTREFGIRMALGARGTRLTAGVIRQTLRVVTIGLAAGLAGAWLAGRGIQGLLYGVGPQDPTVFALVPAVFLLASLAAALPPALRAARTDPVGTLRGD
jgi:predicted permease